MTQLSLNITPRRAYAPEDFVLHAGVHSIVQQVCNESLEQRFRLYYIVGQSRSGKTHLSIKLADELASKNYFPRIIEGQDFSEFILQGLDDLVSEDVLIVDDAQAFFMSLKPGQSGPFVAFVERLRVLKAAIIFLANREVSSFEFDEHVSSRLKPGLGYHISCPASEDMERIVASIAKQHGVKLSSKKLGFVLKRVGRDLASVEAYFERLVHLSQVLGKSIRFPLITGAV